jgi:hypothetical protein
MNGPERVPSGFAQNHVGSGARAGRGLVPAAHSSCGGSGASIGGAASTGGAGSGAVVIVTSCCSVSAVGAGLGPVGPEPQAPTNVKTKDNVSQRCTPLL